MKFRAILNKRHYIHLYHKLKPFPSNVKRGGQDYSKYDTIEKIITYLDVKNYDRIIIVASGPSAKELKKNKNNLHFCCNNSIKLMDDVNYVYLLQDPFYLMKYLKTFRDGNNWKGTIFWFYYSSSSKKMYDTINGYLRKYSRGRREFLLADKGDRKETKQIRSEITNILEKNFNYKHHGVNSGFNTLVFASIIAFLTNKPIDIYGLDAGVGGEKYFYKKSPLGLNIKKENTKRKISEFLEAAKMAGLRFNNYSYFKGNTLS